MPVMKCMSSGSIEYTCSYNFVLLQAPAMWYVHFAGCGDPVRLATVLREALSESKTPLAAPAAAGSPPPIDLDTGAIEATLQAKGTANAGVYGFNVPRADRITDGGMQVPIAAG